MQTIFIQEADQSIREVLRMVIQQEGYQVITAEDFGRQQISQISKAKTALVLLDFKINGECCIRMLKLIKSCWPKLPVIAMSCNSNIKNLYRSLGFDGYLDKPFDIDPLISLIRRFVLPEPVAAALMKKSGRTSLTNCI